MSARSRSAPATATTSFSRPSVSSPVRKMPGAYRSRATVSPLTSSTGSVPSEA